MYEVRRRQWRVTPRQAISVLYRQPAPWAAPFALPLALDLLGAAVAVNGVTLFLTVERPDIAHELAAELPFGVGALVVPFDRDDPMGLVRPFAERDFERLLLVAGDTLGVSVRLLATGFSVLAHESVVVGLSPGGGAFLTGANLCMAVATNELIVCVRAMLGDQEPIPAAIRKLEARTCLSSLPDVAALRKRAADYANILPRTWQRIKELPVT